MKTVKLIPFLLTIALIFGAIGCKDNSTGTVEESIESSQDNALVEGEFTSVFSFFDAQSETTFQSNIKGDATIQKLDKKSELLPDCATASWDSVAKILTIDFGNENCLCKDGLLRRGKITAQFSGKFKEINSNVVLSLVDYYVQDMKVTGSKTVTFLGTAKVNISIENASVVTPTGTISWNSNRTIEKTKGINTLTIWDDEYVVTGSASGVNRKGVAFTVTIDTPLKKKVICMTKDFISGILTIQNDQGATLSINYDPLGTEACNKLASVTVNGKTQTIVLR
ncbi:MAG: hypothetical protein IPM69_10300 [Ignavibacteria bacterium]|nr:hypothetical protein [Ignavibacteria bacterium]